MLLHTIHAAGQLSGYLWKLLPLYERPVDNMVNTFLTVTIFNLEPSEEFKCTDKTYDNCYKEQKMELEIMCKPPFDPNFKNGQPICNTKEKGQQVLSKVTDLVDRCLPTCQQFDINVLDIPSTYLLFEMNKDFLPSLQSVYKFKPGFYINVPARGRHIQLAHNYGFVSFVAEFAGWSSIFVGASLIAILIWIKAPLDYKIFLDFNFNKLIDVVKIISCLILAYLFYACVQRLAKKEEGIMVDFKRTESELDITICATKLTSELVSKKELIVGK